MVARVEPGKIGTMSLAKGSGSPLSYRRRTPIILHNDPPSLGVLVSTGSESAGGGASSLGLGVKSTKGVAAASAVVARWRTADWEAAAAAAAAAAAIDEVGCAMECCCSPRQLLGG